MPTTIAANFNHDDFAMSSKEWATIDGNDVIYHLSDGSTVVIRLTDMGFVIERDDIAIHDDILPYRAGAQEWLRRWIAKNNLTTVPSTEQKGYPWHGWPTAPEALAVRMGWRRERGGKAATVDNDAPPGDDTVTVAILAAIGAF